MNRADAAQAHHKKVLEQDFRDLEYSVGSSIIYDPFEITVSVKDTDCVSAAIDIQNEGVDETCMTILNFASFNNPGGGYLTGAWAQEESLCAESDLYEILSSKKFEEYYVYNRKHINKGLYEDRAIFTPDVKFRRGDRTLYCNVLTCAAPNYNNAIANKVPHNVIVATYKRRLQFIYRILNKELQQVLIAGAWGCGVFGFPRDLSENLFRETATVDTVLAIPSSPNFKPRRSIC